MLKLHRVPGKQEAQLSLRWAHCTAYTSEGQRPTSGKKAIFQSDYSPKPVMVTLVYRTLQSTLEDDKG